MQHNLTIELYGVFHLLLLKMKFQIGKCKLQIGMLKTQVNGKQKILISSSTELRKRKMTERYCKKCNKMCHCPNAEGECTNCECNSRAEDKSFENEGGLVIDDTGECESCQ